MNHFFDYDLGIGSFRIVDNGEAVTQIRLLGKRGGTSAQIAEAAAATEEETPLIRRAAEQLREYLAGERREFDLPLAPQGTEFQKKAWAELCRIPYGETRSYKQIAEAVGCPKGFRAVGMANNRNPIIIVIPCHRVIGANGGLVGYGGGLDVKEQLLKLEGIL